MKIENPTKLDIFFQGGGIIKFPVKNLKKVDVEPIDEQDGGGGGEDSDSLVDFAVSFYNENKNDGNFAILFPSLEEYNQDYKEYVSKEYGNGNNIVYIGTDDEEVVFKFTDDEFTEFMYKTAIFSDWRNNYKSFPINNVIDIDNDGKQFIQVYNSNLLGNFGGAILGYRDGIALGLTGKENFIKLNSIVDAGNMFFRNDSWIYTKTQQFNLNNYNFNQIFDSTFDIYKLKCGIVNNNIEFGLIKIVDKEDNNEIMFTTYSIYNGSGK